MTLTLPPASARAALLCLLSCAGSGNALSQAAPAAPASAAASAGGSVVLRAGSFQLTRPEYEQLLLGFERAAGAAGAAGAVSIGGEPSTQQSGQDVARLLALVSEAQRRGLDQDPKMRALMRVRTDTLLANSLMATLTAEARKDEAGTRALWQAEKDNCVDLRVRQILISHQGAITDPAGGISEPVKSKYGYHLIQFIERLPFAFERMKPTPEHMRARRQFEAIAATPASLDPNYFKR